MITVVKGNIFESNCQALVNPVNTIGVMGKGLAKEFKRIFPNNFKLYKQACYSGGIDCEKLQMGSLFWSLDYLKTNMFATPVTVINFPTKKHYKDNSEMVDIQNGLKSLRRLIIEKDIQSIAIPPLGCGLGGLRWLDVESLIRRELVGLDEVNIVLYEPL